MDLYNQSNAICWSILKECENWEVRLVWGDNWPACIQNLLGILLKLFGKAKLKGLWKADEITLFCFISSFPTVTRWHLVQMTHRVVFSTFAATKSWRCTATTISFAVSPRWPLASPVDYSWLDMTITIATFGIRFVANEQVNNFASNFTNHFSFFFSYTVFPARDSFLHGVGWCHRQAVRHQSRPGAGSVFSR